MRTGLCAPTITAQAAAHTAAEYRPTAGSRSGPLRSAKISAASTAAATAKASCRRRVRASGRNHGSWLAGGAAAAGRGGEAELGGNEQGHIKRLGRIGQHDARRKAAGGRRRQIVEDRPSAVAAACGAPAPHPVARPRPGLDTVIKCIFMHMNTYYSSRAGVYSSRAGARAWQPKPRTAAEAAHDGRSRPCMAAEAAATRRAPSFPSARRPPPLRRMLPRPTGQSCLCTAGDSRNELLTQMQLHNHRCPISRIGQRVQCISRILVFPRDIIVIP